MAAFLLSLLLFAVWFFMGFVAVSSLRGQRHILQNMLLAPVVGVSVIVLSVFLINRAGFPVGQFAPLLTTLLVSAAAVAVRHIRPIFPVWHYFPFAAVLVLALILSGWPMLLYGFDWVAYANNDMVVISAAAQYFLSNAFYAGPNPETLLHGLDYSQYSWFLYVIGMHRIGNEMLLSWVAALSDLRPDQVYMSLTVALHMVLVSATAALTLHVRRLRLAALVTAVLLALSPLSTQAVVNQLSAQVGGLGFLAGSATLLLRVQSQAHHGLMVRNAILLALVISATLLYYPEMMPFLALASALFWVLGIRSRGRTWKTGLTFLGLTALLGLAILNTQLVASLTHLHAAATSGGAENTVLQRSQSLFPFFLKPIGLAVLWGFQTLNDRSPEPLASLAILVGAAALVIGVLASLWQSRHRMPVALITLVMLGLAVRLFSINNDFGLFKLAFFIQPFILATITIALLSLPINRIARVVPLLVISLAGFSSQIYYTLRSADLVAYSVEIWKGSKLGIKSEFEKLVNAPPAGTVIFSDTPNLVLAGLQALASRGRELLLPVELPRQSLRSDSPALQIHRVLRPGLLERLDKMNEMIKEVESSKLVAAEFALHRPSVKQSNYFRTPRLSSANNVHMIALSGSQSIFNRRSYGENIGSNYVSFPLGSASNHLSFVDSSLGSLYYRARNDTTSFYQLEPDLFFKGATMSGIGRLFLFRVINPSEGPRIVLEITASFNAGSERFLPHAEVIGQTRISLPMVGRGSARVFSPPLTPQWIEGIPFLSLDMNREGVSFPSKEHGLQVLYGENLKVDRRKLVAFARDISLVPDSAYRSMVPPSSVSKFPEDLSNPSLEYSGIYEDGWSSEEAFLTITKPIVGENLRVEGMVPMIDNKDFKTELVVLADGAELMRKTVALGQFSITVPMQPSGGRHRIDLRFSDYQKLPGGDDRNVGALLTYVGF